MMGKSPWDDSEARVIVTARRREKGALLPILHDLMERFGYIDDGAIPLIAEILNISRAETLGVVSFYHDFRRTPVDGPVLQLCRAESCQATGCEDLVAHLKLRHGLEVDGNGTGPLTIETVYCLGHCALSPAALLDGEPLARLDKAAIDAIVGSAKESAA